MSKQKPKMATRLVSEATLNRAVKSVVDSDGQPTHAFQTAVLKALGVQHGAVTANLRRLRRKHPDDTPAELADRLGKVYLNSLTTTGAAAGGAAVIPGVGTVATLGTSFAAAIAFLELTGLYIQSVAELAGLKTKTDREAQTLVMALMLGEDGRRLLAQAAQAHEGRGPDGFGTLGNSAALVAGVSGLTESAFRWLRNKFMKRLVVSQGAGLLGRMVPFGIGAVVGGWGNRKLGQQVIISAQKTLGWLPTWEALPGLDEELSPKKLTRKERKELKRAEKRGELE